MTFKWKWTLVIFVFILANSNSIIAQCPEQGIPVLENSEMVDSFLTIYPSCEYIQRIIKVDNVRIYWVKEEVQKNLMMMRGILITVLIGLNLLFKKVTYFNK